MNRETSASGSVDVRGLYDICGDHQIFIDEFSSQNIISQCLRLWLPPERRLRVSFARTTRQLSIDVQPPAFAAVTSCTSSPKADEQELAHHASVPVTKTLFPVSQITPCLTQTPSSRSQDHSPPFPDQRANRSWLPTSCSRACGISNQQVDFGRTEIGGIDANKNRSRFLSTPTSSTPLSPLICRPI